MKGGPEDKLTAGAQRALGLAQLVNKVFAKERVRATSPGHSGYRLEMAAPEGTSTSQGSALQHLKLVPVDPPAIRAPNGAAEVILVGTADPTLSQAELRTLDHLRDLHAKRFSGAELPIDRTEYEALLVKVEQFFDRQGIASTSPPHARPAAPPPPRLRTVAMLVTIAIVALAALMFVVLRSP